MDLNRNAINTNRNWIINKSTYTSLLGRTFNFLATKVCFTKKHCSSLFHDNVVNEFRLYGNLKHGLIFLSNSKQALKIAYSIQFTYILAKLVLDNFDFLHYLIHKMRFLLVFLEVLRFFNCFCSCKYVEGTLKTNEVFIILI